MGDRVFYSTSVSSKFHLLYCLTQVLQIKFGKKKPIKFHNNQLENTMTSGTILAHIIFITYDEVNRYKQSVIQSENLDSSLLVEYFPGTFTQWVADNIDHNVATLDGKDMLHGMGIIAVLTPPLLTDLH